MHLFSQKSPETNKEVILFLNKAYHSVLKCYIILYAYIQIFTSQTQRHNSNSIKQFLIFIQLNHLLLQCLIHITFLLSFCFLFSLYTCSSSSFFFFLKKMGSDYIVQDSLRLLDSSNPPSCEPLHQPRTLFQENPNLNSNRINSGHCPRLFLRNSIPPFGLNKYKCTAS